MNVLRRSYSDEIGDGEQLTYHTEYGTVLVTIVYSWMAYVTDAPPWRVNVFGTDRREITRRFFTRQEAYDFGDFAVKDWVGQ